MVEDEVGGQRRWFERWLVVPKLLYIGLHLVVYAVHAYGTEFFRRQWDLKLSQVGYISALSGFNLVGSIFWSSLADRTGRHKTILVGCTAVYAVLMFALNFHFGNDGVVAKILYTAGLYGVSMFVVSALFPLIDNQVMIMLANDPATTKDTFGRQRLWGTLAHTGVTILANESNKWYLSLRGDSPWLKDHLGDYLGMFIVLIVSAVIFIITVILGIPSGLKHENRQPMAETSEKKLVEDDEDFNACEQVKGLEQEEEFSGDSTTNLKNDDTQIAMEEPSHASHPKSPMLQLLAIPAFLFFILVVLISGVIRSAMSFFQVYFIIALHAGNQDGKDQAAYVALPRLVSEVGVYFFGQQLFHWFGPHWMLITSQATGVFRMLGYAAMPTSGAGSWIVPYFLELLKGLNSGLFASSAVRLASDMAPEGCGNSAQGFVTGTYAGLSTVLGGLLGGLIVSFFPSTIEGERRGMQAMFYILSGSGLVCLILFILKFWLVDAVICTRRRNNASA